MADNSDSNNTGNAQPGNAQKPAPFTKTIKDLVDKIPESAFPKKIVDFVPEAIRPLVLLTAISAILLFFLVEKGPIAIVLMSNFWLLMVPVFLVTLFCAYFSLLTIRKSDFNHNTVLFSTIGFVFCIIMLYAQIKTMSARKQAEKAFGKIGNAAGEVMRDFNGMFPPGN